MNIDQYAELVRQMCKWDHAYYVVGVPEISDQVYDANIKKLKIYESQNPTQVLVHSPTQRIGAPIDDTFEKYTRAEKMYSLDNVYNKAELEAFYTKLQKDLNLEEITLIIEPKIDGVSIECVYENDQLVLATTRGDGVTGEVVTHNVKTIRTLPMKLYKPTGLSRFTIRGEIYIHRKDLLTINTQRKEEGDLPFKNPRNAASGSLRLQDPVLASKRRLRVCFYDFFSSDIKFSSHHEIFDFFKTYGLPTHQALYSVSEPSELSKKCLSLEQTLKDLPFDTDGLVIKVDVKAQQQRLGYTSKYPKWAMAYKFAAQRVETQLLDISFQVGRTGVLTPVAHLNPVQLAGTQVSNATLHNMGEIQRKDIRIGDHVWIEKAGDIIPQVIEINENMRNKHAKKINTPKQCPACGSLVGKSNIDDSAIRCLNGLSCKAQLKGSIAYFCSRKAMNIDHIGPSLIDQLVGTRAISHAGDLFLLKLEDLTKLERMGEKSAQNVLDALEKAKEKATLPKLLTALGIALMGEQGAKLMANHFVDFQSFIKANTDTLELELEAIHGIGKKMAQSVVHFLKDKSQQALIQSLYASGINPVYEAQSETLKWVFVITGKLSKPRDEIIKLIESSGGKVVKQVSKRVTHLVCNKPSSSSKFFKAKALGIEIVSEKILENVLNA